MVRSIDLFQIDPHRVLPGLVCRHIADTMGGQVGMTVLVVWDLVFPNVQLVSTSFQACQVSPGQLYTLHTTPLRPGRTAKSHRATATDAARSSGPEP